ncbi:pectinesterase-like protein [Tanacetum coccineum]
MRISCPYGSLSLGLQRKLPNFYQFASQKLYPQVAGDVLMELRPPVMSAGSIELMMNSILISASRDSVGRECGSGWGCGRGLDHWGELSWGFRYHSTLRWYYGAAVQCYYPFPHWELKHPVCGRWARHRRWCFEFHRIHCQDFFWSFNEWSEPIKPPARLMSVFEIWPFDEAWFVSRFLSLHVGGPFYLDWFATATSPLRKAVVTLIISSTDFGMLSFRRLIKSGNLQGTLYAVLHNYLWILVEAHRTNSGGTLFSVELNNPSYVLMLLGMRILLGNSKLRIRKPCKHRSADRASLAVGPCLSVAQSREDILGFERVGASDVVKRFARLEFFLSALFSPSIVKLVLKCFSQFSRSHCSGKKAGGPSLLVGSFACRDPTWNSLRGASFCRFAHFGDEFFGDLVVFGPTDGANFDRSQRTYCLLSVFGALTSTLGSPMHILCSVVESGCLCRNWHGLWLALGRSRPLRIIGPEPFVGCLVHTCGPDDYYTSSVTMTHLAHNRTSTPANVLNAYCKELMGYAVEELLASSRMLVNPTDLLSMLYKQPELMNFLSVVVAYQETCLDGLMIEPTSTPIIFKAFDHILSGTRGQKLLGTHKKGYPSWMSVDDQKLLGNSDVVLRPHAVVAKEGNGQFKTIMGALAAYPNGNVGTGKICRVPSQELFRTSIEGVLRTIVMESVVDDFIQPDGWLPWQGTFALDTCFYGEYANVGWSCGTDRMG